MAQPSSSELAEARHEARVDATVFVVVALAALIVLAAVSLHADWELIGLRGWVWLILCIPEALLIGGLVRVVESRTTGRAIAFFGSFSLSW